jgi:hypothetical protein
VPEHPWVARNAREALYNVADENVRYLYNNWIPALATQQDRDAASQAQQSRDEMIAIKIAAALDAASPVGRENILRGLTEFHLRNVRAGAGRYARIGNDIEQIRFSAKATKLLDGAISRAQADPSITIRRLAAVAVFTLRDNGPLPVARPLWRAMADPDPELRATAVEFHKSIPLDAGADPSAAILAELIESPYPAARQAVLAYLKSADGRALARDPRIIAAVGTPAPGSDVGADVVAPVPNTQGAAATQKLVRQLDYAYFAQRVMPLFARKSGQDGNACVSCHFNHNQFRVTAPGQDGRFTDAQVREAYNSAAKVVNLDQPEKSLLLLKPISSSNTEGVIDSKTLAHGGGIRWSGPQDPAYKVVLSWLKAAAKQDLKLTAPAPSE